MARLPVGQSRDHVAGGLPVLCRRGGGTLHPARRGGSLSVSADDRGGSRDPRRVGPRAPRLAVALWLLAAEKRLRPRRPARLRSVGGSAVRPWDGIFRAGRPTADPTG